MGRNRDVRSQELQIIIVLSAKVLDNEAQYRALPDRDRELHAKLHADVSRSIVHHQLKRGVVVRLDISTNQPSILEDDGRTMSHGAG
jgi:hypothetical protein